MISRELKIDIFQTMFRIRNMQGLFRTKHRWHEHGRGHQRGLEQPDLGAPPNCGDQHGFGDNRGFTMSAMVILSMIAARTAPEVATGGDAGGSEAQTATSEASFAAELQQRLHVSKAAVSQNLMALEKKGLITRTLNPKDMRRFDFALTDKGRRITDHMQQHMDANVDIVLERMGEQDTRELIRLSNKFIDIIEDLGAQAKTPVAENQERADA
jgi:DNA-binding MarR family transcriptional regulator